MQYKMAQNNVLEGKTSMYKEHEGSEILINLQKISVVLLRWKHWAGNRERFFNVALLLVYKASGPSSFHFLLLPIASFSIVSLCFSPLEVPKLSQSICTWRKLGVSKSRGYVVCEVWRNGGAHLLTGWGTLENSYLIRWSRVQSNLLESPWRWWHLALTQASMGPLRLGQSQKGHTLTTHQILEALLKPLSTCRMIRCDGHYL